MRHTPPARASLLAAILCASAPAFATCNPDNGGCNGYNPGGPTITPALSLNNTATLNSQGTWDYVYTLSRTGTETGVFQYLEQFTLPYFQDALITNLRSTADDAPHDRQIEIRGTIQQAIISTLAYDDFWFELPGKPEEIRFTSPFAPGPQSTAVAFLHGEKQFEPGSYTWVNSPAPQDFAVTLPGSPQAIAASVPEPGQMTLVLSGLLGVLALARRKA
jgi:hypothetical protein